MRFRDWGWRLRCRRIAVSCRPRRFRLRRRERSHEVRRYDDRRARDETAESPRFTAGAEAQLQLEKVLEHASRDVDALQCKRTGSRRLKAYRRGTAQEQLDMRNVGCRNATFDVGSFIARSCVLRSPPSTTDDVERNASDAPRSTYHMLILLTSEATRHPPQQTDAQSLPNSRVSANSFAHVIIAWRLTSAAGWRRSRYPWQYCP